MILEQGPTSNPNQQNHTSKSGSKTTTLDPFGPGVRSMGGPNSGPNFRFYSGQIRSSIRSRGGPNWPTELLQVFRILSPKFEIRHFSIQASLISFNSNFQYNMILPNSTILRYPIITSYPRLPLKAKRFKSKFHQPNFLKFFLILY